MQAVTALILAYIFSFLGSIPPGTLNLSCIQLGLDNKMNTAARFAIGAALVEYPYAWIAIEFENIITEWKFITDHFQLITGLIMLSLGAFFLYSSGKQTRLSVRFHESGFRRGLILSIFNPMALPFWIFITAYLKSLGWITLSTQIQKHAYLLGVSLGAFTLLVSVAHLAKKLTGFSKEGSILKKIPGVTLIFLGIYALYQFASH